jgi:hypothetical protein
MRAQFEARSHRRAWGGSAVAHAGYWRRCSAHAHATAELRQNLRLGSRRQAGVAQQESSSTVRPCYRRVLARTVIVKRRRLWNSTDMTCSYGALLLSKLLIRPPMIICS